MKVAYDRAWRASHNNFNHSGGLSRGDREKAGRARRGYLRGPRETCRGEKAPALPRRTMPGKSSPRSAPAALRLPPQVKRTGYLRTWTARKKTLPQRKTIRSGRSRPPETANPPHLTIRRTRRSAPSPLGSVAIAGGNGALPWRARRAEAIPHRKRPTPPRLVFVTAQRPWRTESRKSASHLPS